MRDLIGTQLGQYQLTEVIRRGGMATVYKAYQQSLDRYVAVKVLFHGQDPQFVARFQREARAIAHLQHPNILPIFDNGEQDGLLFLVLQYIEQGMTLGDLLGHPMEPVPALQLMVHVLAALEYAHERGIVHRDIKPANILMPTPSWPMLADFGIAKLLTENENANLTAQGMIIGTAAYVAPEQVLGMHIDRRTDLYSAGIVLYEMVTGRVPFDRGTPIVVATKQAYEAPPSPRALNPDLPPAVETVVLRALEKDPANRYQTALEMAAALERVARHLSRTTGHSEITNLYRAGVGALEAGHWDEAIIRLRQVVRLDPGYEDASELLEAAEMARTQQDLHMTPAPPQSEAAQVAAAPEPPSSVEDELSVPGPTPAGTAEPEAVAPAVALPPAEQAPVTPAAPPPEEIVQQAEPAAPQEAPAAPAPIPPGVETDAASPALAPTAEAAPAVTMADLAPLAAEPPAAAEIVRETPPAAASTAAVAPEIEKPPARKRSRRAPKRAPRPPLPAESPTSAPATFAAETAPEVAPPPVPPAVEAGVPGGTGPGADVVGGDARVPPALEAGMPGGTPTVIAPVPKVGPVPAPGVPSAVTPPADLAREPPVAPEVEAAPSAPAEVPPPAPTPEAEAVAPPVAEVPSAIVTPEVDAAPPPAAEAPPEIPAPEVVATPAQTEAPPSALPLTAAPPEIVTPVPEAPAPPVPAPDSPAAPDTESLAEASAATPALPTVEQRAAPKPARPQRPPPSRRRAARTTTVAPEARAVVPPAAEESVLAASQPESSRAADNTPAAGAVVAGPPAPPPAPAEPQLEMPAAPPAPAHQDLPLAPAPVAAATPPSTARPPAGGRAIPPDPVPGAPDVPVAPAAALAWRAPELPAAPGEAPGGVESLPVVEDSPPARPPGVNMEAAVATHPRMVEQEAARPAAPAGQRRMVPILVGGVAVVLLLLAGAAFLFRPPAPPATVTPTTLPTIVSGGVPRLATATTAPPSTAAVPTTAATLVAAAPTATTVPAPATAPPSPTPSTIATVPVPPPAGNLVWQDNFDPPAATPTLEYDRYALVSRSGLENDFDFLNTPGSTAGFQHPGTYRIQFDSPNQTRAVALARFAYSAFTMQIELSDASDAAATGNLGQGVVVRERDRDHLYAVLLNSRSGQYTVRKLDGKDHWSDLIPWTASPLIKRPGAAHRLRVDGKGDQFTVYLNEAVLAHFSDSAYQFGMLGLIGISGDAGKTVLDFDNLAIWSSDTLTGPPATLDAARGMILIPGGEFIMGWYAKPEEQAHIVAVPSFYLDATEVTNKAYKQCIAAGKCSPPDAPAPGDPVPANYFQDPRFDSNPVVYVSWAQAQTFCGWANKRLPTEAEWEKAAGWDSTTRVKTIWPWADNQYDPKRLNSNESNPDLTTPVQHFGPELNGTFDMAGNVREWTSSLNKAYPYNAADGREDPRSPGARIFRGDSWLHTWGKAQTFFREGSPPSDQTADVGFRCAATP